MLLKVVLFTLAALIGANERDWEICGKQNKEVNEFPWFALLKYETVKNETAFLCAASLINKRYLLTTTYCVKPISGKLVGVRLGNVLKGFDCDANGANCNNSFQDLGIEATIIYKPYNSRKFQNVISLIRLEKDVVFNENIKPICLPTQETALAEIGNEIITTGLIRDDETNKRKKHSSNKIISNEQCQDELQGKVNVTEEVFCAVENNNDSPCSGDGGGPAMYLVDGRWYQQGIISFGTGCYSNKKPKNIGGYTKITSYLEWIDKNIQP